MNVIFDLGNVVVTWDPVAIVRSVIEGPGAVRLAEQLFAHADWVEVDRGTLTLDEAALRAIERTDVDADIIHAIYRAVAPSLLPLPQSVELLHSLKKQGHQLYALSNMGHVSADYLQQHGVFWPLFNDVIISARVGLVKPELAIYRHMLQQLGLRAEEAVFIDDSLPNVLAARELGLRAIHYLSHAQCLAELLVE